MNERNERNKRSKERKDQRTKEPTNEKTNYHTLLWKQNDKTNWQERLTLKLTLMLNKNRRNMIRNMFFFYNAAIGFDKQVDRISSWIKITLIEYFQALQEMAGHAALIGRVTETTIHKPIEYDKDLFALTKKFKFPCQLFVHLYICPTIDLYTRLWCRIVDSRL